MPSRIRLLVFALITAACLSVIAYATDLAVHEAEYCAVYPTCRAAMTSVHGL